MDLTSYLPDSALGYVNLGSLVIAAGSIFAASISKYTANKTDDKIAGWLAKAHDLLGFVGLHPKLAQKRAPLTTATRPVVVRDQRSAPKRPR